MEIVNASSITVSSMPMWWPDNSLLGILFFILGICGAAIMVWIGEWDKLMGKSARIIEIENEIEKKRKISDKLTDPNDVDKRIKYEDSINKDEIIMDRERRDTRITGIILYLFIGGVLAAILANSMVEAVGFGAGWTGLIGVFGIKKDIELKEKSRITEMQTLEENLQTLKENFEDAGKKTQDAYLQGLSDAIEKIAKAENKSIEDILKLF